MKILKKFKLFRKIATVVSFLLFGILVVGSVIAWENSNQVSTALNAKTFYTVDNTDPSVDTEYYKSDFKKVDDLIAAGRNKAADVVAEGSVLLKNENNALPLTEGNRKVSVFGMRAVDVVYGGTGSGGISSADAVNFTKSMEDAGLELNPTLKNNYSNKEIWYTNEYRPKSSGWGSNVIRKINDVPWSVVESASSSFDAYSDAAIFFVGRVGGEGSDLLGHGSDGIDKGDGLGADYLGLSETELGVLKGLSDLRKSNKFKRLIVIINSASMIEGDFLHSSEYAVDAALWVGTVGMGGAAVGKILAGDIVPSGHMSDTMWMDNALNPANVNFGYWTYEGAQELDVPTKPGNMWVPEPTLSSYVVYQEGMYLGYKYTETRYEDYVTDAPNVGSFNYKNVVAYPFGYGLSYTNFEYSDFAVTKKDARNYEVSVKVTNKGTVYSGRESVQIYVSKPYGEYARTNKIQVPSVELINFGKTEVLKPGASEVLKITLDEKFFASYDAYGAKGYVLMDGDYYVTAAKNAHDAVNNVLAAKGKTPENTDGRMDTAGNNALVKKFALGFDKEKYAYSDSVSSLDGKTHNRVSNLFDFADINLYSGRGTNSVQYFTRDNWNAMPTDITNGHPNLVMTEQMAREIYAQTPDGLRQPVPSQYSQPLQKDDVAYPTMGKDSGLMLMDMMYDSDGNPIDFFNPVWDVFLDQLTYDELCQIVYRGYHLTSGIAKITKPETNDENGPNGFNQSYGKSALGLFYRTEKAAGHTTEGSNETNYTEDANPNANTKTTGFPANGLLAASFDIKLAGEVGNIIGNDGIWSGMSGLYGIGANIHRSPYLGRVAEYYSEDGMLTGIIAAYECKEIEAKGVHVYNKHCAVNDQETCRHGVGVWINEQALREIYLRAFELPITIGGAYNTMASFARFGTYSGSACKELGTDFLRGECGMKGIIVTDCYTDMNGKQGSDPYYEHAYGVLVGGCDIPDGNDPYDTEKDHERYKEGFGELAWAVRLSAKRVLWQTLHSNAMNGFSSDTRIVQIMPWWQQLLISLDVIIGFLFLVGVAWTLAVEIPEFLQKRKMTA
ncbi:MAG: beta-glucosidase [Clostridia bacterium]|nr:beta-glucosidase [Clostridia bacterium]